MWYYVSVEVDRYYYYDYTWCKAKSQVKEVKKVENLEIRRKLKETKVMQWQVADKLGVSEMTLVRKLRYELPEEEKQKIFSVIEEIAVEKNNKNK